MMTDCASEAIWTAFQSRSVGQPSNAPPVDGDVVDEQHGEPSDEVLITRVAARDEAAFW
jgi:hypothetical protein